MPRAALRALGRVQKEKGESLSPLAWFRLLANMASAHMVLGEDDHAIPLFRQSYEAYPEYPNARATMAMVHLIEGDTETAYKMARDSLRDDPESSRAAGIVIDLMPVTSLAEIEAALPSAALARMDTKLQLSIRAHRFGDHASGLRYAEEALAIAPDDARNPQWQSPSSHRFPRLRG
jgi:cellulose synthase operon protein C